MFDYLEVHKVDSGFSWLELKAIDESHREPVTIRLVSGDDPKKMAKDFISRYMARRQADFPVPEGQLHMIEELCEEASMARVLSLQGKASPDLLELLPTTVLHFKYPEKTSFRKSRAARINLFSEEALDALAERDFERVIHRLNWVHMLDPSNEAAFQWKVVCLRSWKKMAECVPVFEAWIQAHPNSIEPRLGLGEMWLFLGQNQRALDTFSKLMNKDPNNIMALMGLIQAKAKLGEDPLPDLRKAWMVDPNYTVEMIEHQMDFRMANSTDLVPKTLRDIAREYQIPLKRVKERAIRGVLPMHPAGEDRLLRFSKAELDRHYKILKCVGLEIAGARKEAAEPLPVQPSLFEEDQV